ncbi:hypothetical protein K1719_007244 [Acacia pycnantha]|nr:hypothetical protein K1719_007244 [Acacia pycnantha]
MLCLPRNSASGLLSYYWQWNTCMLTLFYIEDICKLVTQFVNGLFESTNDLSIFKNHIRDFLGQSKEFSAQDNKDLYADEVAAQRAREHQRMLSIPWLIAPNELQDHMVDSD